jgi:hypothetical protein
MGYCLSGFIMVGCRKTVGLLCFKKNHKTKEGVVGGKRSGT